MPVHTIRRGETLSAIADRYRVSVSTLARANGIVDPNAVPAGRRLQIPGAADTFEPASSTPARTASTGTAGGASATMRRLAAEGRRVALRMGGYSSQGKCATGVNRAILNATGYRNYGHANQIDNNLPRNRFREVHMSLAEALRTPGLVLTWERTSTRAGRIYGHTAITTGDGRSSVSDFVERNTLSAGGRSGLRIFMPIA